MAFTKLKNHISNLSTPFVAKAINHFASGQNSQTAGKVAAKLQKKSPFNIDSAPSQQLIENPLSFTPIQYPLDLGSNELGHYMIFESGFVGYSHSSDKNFNDAFKNLLHQNYQINQLLILLLHCICQTLSKPHTRKIMVLKRQV